MNFFVSVVNFSIKDECNETVKIIDFEMENEKGKVEILGQTNWMLNRRYYFYLEKKEE